MSAALADVRTIATMLNDRAASLAPELLPNGVRDGRHWKTSSIDDVKTGRYSLVVDISGSACGQWKDFGGCRSGEDRGDMLDLIRLKRCGGDKAKAIEWAKSWLGIHDMDRGRFEQQRVAAEKERSKREAAAEAEQSKKRDKAKSLFLRGYALNQAEASPAVDYLRGRGIDLERLGRAPGSLRFLPDCYNSERQGPLPAMVASINALDGRQLGAHRTYLASDAQRGWIKHPRLADAKLTYGPSIGGHISLWKGAQACPLKDIAEGTPVYVSEGIEDGLSIAMAMPEARVIAAVSLSKLGKLALPPQAGKLIVIGQNDGDHSPAVDALERGIAEQQSRGVRVQILYPPRAFKDFNEWLQKDPQGFFGQREGQAA